jgi:streptomycin 3"-adenylyltransferase
MARTDSVPLLGPAASEILDPVPPEDLTRAMVAGIDGLLADMDGDERNVVLTLARIWSSLTTGRILSKDAAADWALPRLPEEHRQVLARARAIYLGDEEERWDDLRDRLRPYAEHVIREIRGQAAGRPRRPPSSVPRRSGGGRGGGSSGTSSSRGGAG